MLLILSLRYCNSLDCFLKKKFMQQETTCAQFQQSQRPKSHHDACITTPDEDGHVRWGRHPVTLMPLYLYPCSQLLQQLVLAVSLQRREQLYLAAGV